MKPTNIKIIINDVSDSDEMNLDEKISLINNETKELKIESIQQSPKKMHDLNLVYELDYLGYIEIESKYLQRSIIPWLIATLKLIETKQHIKSIYFKINPNKNLLTAYKPNNEATSTNESSDDNDCDYENNDLFSHKLTNIFKVTQLTDDPLCFGYVYRDANLPNKCRLYAFYSNKVNLAQMLIQLQYKAFKCKKNNEKDSTKKFEVDLVGEVYISNSELNMPNLIEICMKKIQALPQTQKSTTTTQNPLITKSQSVPPLNQQQQQPQVEQSFSTSLFSKKKSNKENLNKRITLNIEKKLRRSKQIQDDIAIAISTQQQQHQHQHQPKNVLFNFSKSKLIIEDMHTNLLIIKLNYKKILYFNNSMLNQKYFCLAYNECTTPTDDPTTTTTQNENTKIKAMIFYALKNSLIDDLIKEFAYNLTNLNYNEQNQPPPSPTESISSDTTQQDATTINKRTCQYCPLQQYVQLCDHLNEHLILNKHEKIYLILNKIINNLESDKEFIKELCNELNINPKRNNFNGANIEHINQLLCSILYKLCYIKQMQHLHVKTPSCDSSPSSSSYPNLINENFNLLDNIYDIDFVDHDCDKDKNSTTLTNEFSLKRKFNKTPPPLTDSNKVIRTERLSLGNIYSKNNLPAINLLDSDNDMRKLLFKRKSTTFESTSSLDKSGDENNKNDFDKQQQQQLLSVSMYASFNEHNNSQSIPIASCLSPSPNNNFIQFQSTPNYYKRRESMRRSIFNKVIGSPSSNETTLVNEKNLNLRRKSAVVLFDSKDASFTLAASNQSQKQQVVVPTPKAIKIKRFKTRDDIRQFWKKIISEQILLIKMDHENKKLKAKALAYEQIPRRRRRQNMAFMDYNEIESMVSKNEITSSWKNVMRHDVRFKKQISIDDDSSSTTSNSTPSTPVLVTSNINFENVLNDLSEELDIVDIDRIRNLVLKGVPQLSRDTIWLWLSKQYILRNQKQIQKNKKNINFKLDVPYADLLKDNTTHQHAIMIDLGRTFPTHPNFSQQFGAGQLALFNILKAYSILDPEVGYCQGLSFIVGVLLIHCDNDEEKTFELLKHLLINLGLRKQFKPDMFALQKYMYQITRLLYDHQSQLYQHLEDNEASAQLYCAPWFLTLFASQFEMGFVARIFDFLFAEGPIILFKTSLAILDVHKALLLHCEAFEVIINYLKITVPEMSLIQTEIIMNKAFNYDIQRDLDAYEIEFYIFQEELQTYSAMNNHDNDNIKLMQLPPTITLAPIVASNNLIKFESSTTTTTTIMTSGGPNMEKRGSTSSLSSSSNYNAQLSQLEQINLKLKERVEDLLEQLQLFQVNKSNQEDLIYKLQHENSQLKCKVETLEIERLSLLNQLKNDRD